MAEDKTRGPVTCLVFLGLEIDTVEQCIRIPSADSFFFSKAVRGSRAFNRRFYDAMIGVANPHYKVRVSSAVKEDMQMWLQFLDKELGPRTAKLALFLVKIVKDEIV